MSDVKKCAMRFYIKKLHHKYLQKKKKLQDKPRKIVASFIGKQIISWG